GLRSCKRRTGIEAEPAEPEQPGAEHHEGNICRKLKFASLHRAAPSEDHGARERRDSRGHVHDSPAGEVENAPLVEKPVRMPRPMRERRVHEDAEKADEEKIAREARALRE